MISLKECGAVPGQPADDALRKAVDIVASGAESTVFWDGPYGLTRRCFQSFLGTKGKHLAIVGDGPHCRILPAFPATVQALVFQNLETFTFDNLAIAGNGNHKQFDCGNLLHLSTIKQVVWDRVHMYGLATDGRLNPYGLVFVYNAGFNYTRSLISGTTAAGAGVFTLGAIRRCHISGSDIMDYGELSGGQGGSTFQSKVSLGLTKAWFRFTDPHSLATGGGAYQGIPLVENLTLDEGAERAVSCEGRVFGSSDSWMRGIHLRDVSVNVRHSGLYFNRVESVTIEDSYTTWQENPCLAIEGMDVRSMHLVNCRADKNARTIQLRRSAGRPITPGDPVDRLVLDRSPDFTVDAPQTLVTHLPAKSPKLFAIGGPESLYLDATPTSDKGATTMDGILLMIKEALTSKKFIVTVAGTISAAAMRIGLEMPIETVAAVLTPMIAYLLAQGWADSGKEAAKVAATVELAMSPKTAAASKADNIPQPVKDKLL